MAPNRERNLASIEVRYRCVQDVNVYQEAKLILIRYVEIDGSKLRFISNRFARINTIGNVVIRNLEN